MKILILANVANGLYRFRRELIEVLCADNEVVISVPDGDMVVKMVEMGCQYIPVKMDRRGTSPVADLKLLNSYKKIIVDVKPDIVLTYTIKPNVYGGMACQRLKVPYIANVTGLGTALENGGILKFVASSLYRRGLKHAKCVFFQNLQNQEILIRERIAKGNTKLIFFKRDYFHGIRDGLKGEILIVNALYEGETAASSLFLYTPGSHAHYHLSATRSDCYNLAANNLILRAACEELRRRGCTWLHLGGGLSCDPSDSLLAFKRSFGRLDVNRKDFYIGKKVWNEAVYERVVDEFFNAGGERNSFFPECRG